MSNYILSTQSALMISNTVTAVTDAVLVTTVLTSSSEIRHSRPTQKREEKKQRTKRKQKLKQHVDVTQISLAVHTLMVGYSLHRSLRQLQWLLGGFPRCLWLLQGRAL